VQSASSVSWAQCFRGTDLYRTLIVLGIQCLQQGQGECGVETQKRRWKGHLMNEASPRYFFHVQLPGHILHSARNSERVDDLVDR